MSEPTQPTPKEKDRIQMLIAMLDKMNVGTCGVISGLTTHINKVRKGEESDFNHGTAVEDLNKVLGGIVALQRLFTATAGGEVGATAVADVTKKLRDTPKAVEMPQYNVQVSDLIGEKGLLKYLVSPDVVPGGLGTLINADSEKPPILIQKTQPATAYKLLSTGLYKYNEESTEYDALAIRLPEDQGGLLLVWKFSGEYQDVYVLEPPGRALRLTVAGPASLNRMYGLIRQILETLEIKIPE